jgi:hypothetical protein
MKIERALFRERQRVRDIIKAQYPDRVRENTDRLCQVCWLWQPGCRYGLVPVTSTGADCPYFHPAPTCTTDPQNGSERQ